MSKKLSHEERLLKDELSVIEAMRHIPRSSDKKNPYAFYTMEKQ